MSSPTRGYHIQFFPLLFLYLPPNYQHYPLLAYYCFLVCDNVHCILVMDDGDLPSFPPSLPHDTFHLSFLLSFLWWFRLGNTNSSVIITTKYLTCSVPFPEQLYHFQSLMSCPLCLMCTECFIDMALWIFFHFGILSIPFRICMCPRDFWSVPVWADSSPGALHLLTSFCGLPLSLPSLHSQPPSIHVIRLIHLLGWFTSHISSQVWAFKSYIFSNFAPNHL